MKRISTLFLSASFALGIACGDNVTPDEPAGPDAATPNPNGMCGLWVGSNETGGRRARGYEGADVAGIPVFFFSPDGQLLHQALTDVKGEASFDDCVPDSMITFVLELDEGDRPGIVTYTNVQPGDTVHYRTWIDEPPLPDTYGNVSVTPDQDVSFDVQFDGTGIWGFDLGCEDQEGYWHAADAAEEAGLESPLRVPSEGELGGIDRDCLGETATDIDVLAVLEDEGEIRGYAFMKDVAFTEGTEEAHTDTSITMPAWTPGNLDNAWIISNLPPLTESWSMYMGHVVDGQKWFTVPDSDYYSDFELVPPSIAGAIKYGLPEGFGEATAGSLYWYTSNYGMWSRRFDLDFVTPFSTTTTFDVSDALPRIDSISVLDTFSTQPGFSWQSPMPIEGTMAVFDFVLVVTALDGCCSPDGVQFTVVTPTTAAGEFRIPELPEEILRFFADRTVDAIPLEMSIVDTDWASYQDMITNLGFDPFTILNQSSMPKYATPRRDWGSGGRLRRTSIRVDFSEDDP